MLREREIQHGDNGGQDILFTTPFALFFFLL